jgi:hypothetical protein
MIFFNIISYINKFLKIWNVIAWKFELLSFSFKSDNIFVHLIGSFGYWNRQIGCIFFQHVCLCWCIWLLRIYVLIILWLVVKYLSTKFYISSFVEIPNLGAFLDHNNPWSWAKLVNWNFIIKKSFILPNKILLS